MADELGFLIEQAYRTKVPSEVVRLRLLEQARSLVRHGLMRHFSAGRRRLRKKDHRSRQLGVGRKLSTADYMSPFHLGPLGCRM